MHPRDRVTPFFDLFRRLGDVEIARLAETEVDMITEIRPVLESIVDPLEEFEEVLRMLDDVQVSKAFGLPETAVRIWRLCRAPDTLSAAERNAEGVLNDIMGEPEADLTITVEDSRPLLITGDAPETVDWSDL